MKRAALLVGIDEYKNGITSLNCAVSDAKALHTALAGTKFDRVDSLYNREAHCETILEQVEECVRSLSVGDLFVFYFAGHGRKFDGEHFLGWGRRNGPVRHFTAKAR